MSELITVPYCLNSDYAVDPTIAYEDDAGFDLYAELLKPVIIEPFARIPISTGVIFEMPRRSRGIIHDKSGIAKSLGLTILGRVIDSCYRGVVEVLLYNTSANESVIINPKQKIAQILFDHNLPITKLARIERKALSQTERGNRGFGSSGINV